MTTSVKHTVKDMAGIRTEVNHFCREKTRSAKNINIEIENAAMAGAVIRIFKELWRQIYRDTGNRYLDETPLSEEAEKKLEELEKYIEEHTAKKRANNR